MDLTLQRAELTAVGCRRTFEEKVSGARRNRAALGRMLKQLCEDNVAVITLSASAGNHSMANQVKGSTRPL
nr:recombinase family protein [Polymorphobacter sp. PAMC 29334]